MQLTINTKQLLSSLQLVSKGVSTNNIVPASSCFRLFGTGSKLEISTCNLEVSMLTSLPINFTGDVLIPSDKIITLLSSLPDQPLIIDISPSFEIKVTAGSGIYELSGYDGSDFPVIKTDGNETIEFESSDLTEAIYSTAYARSTDPVQTRFIGLNLDLGDGATFAGCNLLLLSVFKLDGKFKKGKLLLPVSITNIIGSLNVPGYVKISYSENSICFEYQNLTVMSLLSGEKFPDYSGIVPKNDVKLTITRVELLSAIKRVLQFSNKVSKQIFITSANCKLIVTGSDTNFKQKATETINVSEKSEIEISVNGGFLHDALSHMSCEYIEIYWSAPNVAIIIHEPEVKENFVMIMAMVNQ